MARRLPTTLPPPDANPMFPAAGTGLELLRGATVLYRLPLTMKIAQVGSDLTQTLERAPLSNVVFGLGDSIATPDYLMLTGTCAYGDYRDGLTQMSLMRQATRLADRVFYKGKLFSVLQPGLGNLVPTMSDGRDDEWTVALKLVPFNLLNAEVLGINAGFINGLLGVRGVTGNIATVYPVPGTTVTPGTFDLINGATGQTYTFETIDVNYTLS